MINIYNSNNSNYNQVYNVREIATLLNVGANKLFKYLRDNKILDFDNTPMVNYIELGLLTYSTTVKRNNKVYVTSLFTEEGYEALKRKLIKSPI